MTALTGAGPVAGPEQVDDEQDARSWRATVRPSAATSSKEPLIQRPR